MRARLPDWERRLRAYVESRRDAPFVVGVNDCVSFARGAIEAMTGADPCPDLRWTTQAEADALLEEGLERLVSGYLGEPVPVYCVKTGGILLLEHGRGVGVKIGARAVLPGTFAVYDQLGEGETRQVFKTECEGIVFLPLSRFARGWHV